MKNIFNIACIVFLSIVLFTACSESTGEADPYANWDQRNQNYIDSIAKVARANEGNKEGEWKILYSYKLTPLAIGMIGDVNDYVYCKIQKVGDGATPLFNDTSYVDYKGYLINKTVFDKSYRGEYNQEFAVPVAFETNSLVCGFTTALMQMKEGDIWTLYIPSDLGYGTSGSGSTIPENSTLIFDTSLIKVGKLKGIE